MKLNKKTKTKEILPLLNEERLNLILEKVPAMPLKKKVLEMTIGEYIEASEPEYALEFLKEKRALKAFGMLKQYRKEMEDVAKFFETHTLSNDPKDIAAMSGVDFPNFKESILLETRDSFNLQRLDSTGMVARFFGNYGAVDIPIAEYLLTLKSKVASAQFERNRQRNIERKTKYHAK